MAIKAIAILSRSTGVRTEAGDVNTSNRTPMNAASPPPICARLPKPLSNSGSSIHSSIEPRLLRRTRGEREFPSIRNLHIECRRVSFEKNFPCAWLADDLHVETMVRRMEDSGAFRQA